jgi:hypothetical protein
VPSELAEMMILRECRQLRRSERASLGEGLGDAMVVIYICRRLKLAGQLIGLRGDLLFDTFGRVEGCGDGRCGYLN